MTTPTQSPAKMDQEGATTPTPHAKPWSPSVLQSGSGYPVPGNPAVLYVAGPSMLRSPADENDLVHHYPPDIFDREKYMTPVRYDPNTPPSANPSHSPKNVNVKKSISISDLTPSEDVDSIGFSGSGPNWKVSQDTLSLGKSGYRARSQNDDDESSQIAPLSLSFGESPVHTKTPETSSKLFEKHAEDPSPKLFEKKRKGTKDSFERVEAIKRQMRASRDTRPGVNKTMLDYYFQSLKSSSSSSDHPYDS